MSTLIFLSLYYCIDFLIRVPLDQVWIIRVSVKADVIDDNSEAAKEATAAVDELKLCDAEEEKYLRNDPVAKWQFDYNRVICFGNDFPELPSSSQNDPISVAPGEGLLHEFYLIVVYNYVCHFRENS